LLRHLETREGASELRGLLAAASVHKTDLFRDEGQLEALEREVLAPLAREGRPLELWSAGCSTGEEVATLLLLLARSGAHADSRVLGTDLAEVALSRARALTYSAEAMRRVPPALATLHFSRDGGGFRLAPALAARARFEVHNLMEAPYPRPGAGQGFDVILCRNVLIYFTPGAVEQTVGRLLEQLAPGGTLVLSAAEPLLRPRDDLEVVRAEGSFFYRHRRSVTGRVEAPVGLLAEEAPLVAPAEAPPDPRDGEALFSLVLEWAAEGQREAETEAGLRKVLSLTPELAAARYCLGLLLERRGLRALAAGEYQRALSLLEASRARPTPFFLNPERLGAACRQALRRLA
jgi:chemotaxis protein methyltransferase CheR